MKFKWMAAACAAMIVGGASAQNAVQWRAEDGGNGHWYKVEVVTPGSSWTAANAAATAQNGYLASVRSGAEADFVKSLANTTTGAFTSNPGGNEVGPWLGGTRILGTNGWRWTSGESWNYTQWCAGEPNGGSAEPYVHLMRNGAAQCWNDRENNAFGSGNPSYIVEWSADCNGDGIVDYGQCRDGSLPDYNGNNIPDCCETEPSCVVGKYPVQFRAAEGGNGHWYTVRVYPHVVQWDEARVQAERDGAHLATLTSQSENDFVMVLVGTNGPWFAPGLYPDVLNGPWLGGSRASVDSPWSWVTGEEWGFTAFCLNQPSNNACVEPENRLYIKLGADCLPNRGWGDISASAWCPPELPGLVSAVVEWSADCNSDGLVDYGQILTGQLADANSNGIPDTCEIDPCPGDVTNNGVVNGTDLAAVLAAWGSDGSNKFDCDIDNDGVVGGGDLAFVLAGWGACP